MIHKKLVQYGAGNIGRGFIGELFARSGYEVVFIDVQEAVVEQLNRDREYPVKYISDEGSHETMITGVRAVNGRDMDAVAREIADADIMATAVGVPVLPRIVKPIAHGLKYRWETGNDSPLDIILCENKLDADKYLRELFSQEFSAEENEKFTKTVGLIEASIGRMVPVMTPEMQEGNPLRVCVESYAELPVDGHAMKGEIPRVPGLVTTSPFSYYIRRKLFIHNMGHSLTAYLGRLHGNTYIAQAIRNPHIRLIAECAMRQSARALSREYREYGKELEGILDHVDDLILRFHNSALGDTTERVGRDPIRKLAAEDRLAGAAIFCDERKLPCAYITIGLAAGLLYENAEDAGSLKIQEIVREKGISRAITEICGIVPDSDAGCQTILFYEMLKSGRELGEILHEADLQASRTIHGTCGACLRESCNDNGLDFAP